jgi:hypothetical protein
MIPMIDVILGYLGFAAFIVVLFWTIGACLERRANLGRQTFPEWTKYDDNGRPVCGVGKRGFWTTNVTIGDEPWPFKRRKDGTWYDPETGKDCVVVSLKELLEREEIKDE